MKNEFIFEEKQRFTQWWLYLLISLPLFIVFFNLDWNLGTENIPNSGNASFSLILPKGFWVILLEVALIFIFFTFASLTTQIDKEKIRIRHLIFYRRTIYWEDVESAEIIKYGFVGYGIRLTTRYGIVYNVKGNKGLFLRLKNGKECVIGTQRTEDLAQISQKLLRNP